MAAAPGSVTDVWSSSMRESDGGRLRVAIGQIPVAVGAIGRNAERIAEVMAWAEHCGADVLVLPELALTGYPVADLVLHREFVAEAEEAAAGLAEIAGETTTVVGTVTRVPARRSWDSVERDVSISAVVLNRGEVRGAYHKILLPTYGAFDEGRNIAPGGQADALWAIGDVVAGISICEDLWSGDGPPEAQARAGAQILLAPNASPYHRTKRAGRERHTAQLARRNGVPLVYANLVGGQDDIVFDGSSLVIGVDGTLLYRAPAFREDRAVLDVALPAPRVLTTRPTTVHAVPRPRRPPADAPRPHDAAGELEEIWGALCTGTRDFVEKNGFRRVILGLSGGMDAAFTAALAAEALGPDAVLGVAMPGPDTDPDELDAARDVAEALGIGFAVVPLEPLVSASASVLASATAVHGPWTTEALDAPAHPAQLRAGVLTTMSAAHGLLLLATTNKTELSIGAAIPHSDTVGGFAPLRDCPKTLLYRLAAHPHVGPGRIPRHVLEKRTSAQERFGEGFPSYEVLDVIVQRYVQYGEGVEDLAARGYDVDVVLDVLARIDAAESVRRQAPLGVTISPRAFGTDRRMPVTNAWRPTRRRDSGRVDPAHARFPLGPETAADPDR